MCKFFLTSMIQRITLFQFISLFQILSISVHIVADSVKATTNSPTNIVLIVADDLGYGDVGPFGAITIRTPALDRMAREGLRMTQFYVTSSICSPSRASMLTGRLPVRSGVYTALDPPADELFRVFYPSSAGCMLTTEVTIAKKLSSLPTPYRTALVGKWHLGHNPEKGCLPTYFGFDSFFGLPYSHEEGYPGPAPEGIVWPPVPLFANTSFIEQPFNSSDLTKRYTEKAISFIQPTEGGDEQPFFLHIAYEAPHVPLFTGPEYIGISRRGTYGDAVEEMDASIGSILDVVRGDASLSNNTLVIFISDNGAWIGANTGLENPYLNQHSGIGPFDGGSNGPLRGGKGSTWEGGVRVPCLVWWPGITPPGSTSMAPISALDFYPTFVNIAMGYRGGIKQNFQETSSATEILDGHDVSTIWAHPQDKENDFGPWYDDFMWFWREKEVYAVRSKRYKVHWITRSGFNTSDEGSRQIPPIVYDIESDPSEAYPLTTDIYPDLPKLLVDCEMALKKHLEDIGQLPAPQYGPQNWTLVPCCPRGEFDPSAAIAAARAGDWGLALWDGCVCERE